MYICSQILIKQCQSITHIIQMKFAKHNSQVGGTFVFASKDKKRSKLGYVLASLDANNILPIMSTDRFTQYFGLVLVYSLFFEHASRV